jgi:hypothetical protein
MRTIAIFNIRMPGTTHLRLINPGSFSFLQFVHLHPKPTHLHNNSLPFRCHFAIGQANKPGQIKNRLLSRDVCSQEEEKMSC